MKRVRALGFSDVLKAAANEQKRRAAQTPEQRTKEEAETQHILQQLGVGGPVRFDFGGKK